MAMISSLVGTADTSGRAFLAPLTKSLPTDLGFLVKSTSGVALHIKSYLSAENLTSYLAKVFHESCHVVCLAKRETGVQDRGTPTP